jgi:hypothetical protein
MLPAIRQYSQNLLKIAQMLVIQRAVIRDWRTYSKTRGPQGRLAYRTTESMFRNVSVKTQITGASDVHRAASVAMGAGAGCRLIK